MNRLVHTFLIVSFVIGMSASMAKAAPITSYEPTSWDKEAFLLLSQIESSTDPVEKWIKLNELSDLFRYITDKRTLADKLLSMVQEDSATSRHKRAKQSNPVWLNERLLIAAWDLMRSTGRFSEANQIMNRLNVYNQGYVAGPFENEGGAGMTIQYEPEQSFLLSTQMKGKILPVHWRLLPQQVQTMDTMNLSNFFYPSRNSVIYYAIGIESKYKKRYIRLAISFSESVRVYLNGKLGYEFLGKADSGLDKAYLKLPLVRGTNLLLIKVGANEGASYTLGVHFSGLNTLGLPKGTSITTDPQKLMQAAQRFLPAQQEIEEPFEELPSPVQILEERSLQAEEEIERLNAKQDVKQEELANAKEEAAEINFQLAKALFYTKYFDREERSDERALDQAAELLGMPGVELLLWRADITAEAKTRMDALQEAYRQEPFHPLVAVKFAAELWKIGLKSRAIQVLKQALKRHKDNMDLRLSYLSYIGAFEDSARLWRSMAKIYMKYPANPYIVKSYVRAIDNSNRIQDMLPVREYWLKLELDPDNLWWLYNEYLQRRKIQAAIHVLDTIEALYPFSTGAKMNRAELLFGMGKTEEARAVYLELLSMRPNDPAVIDKFALFEAMLGNHQKALQLWRKELRIKPQDAELKERLAAIEEREDFAKPYIADARDIAQKIAPPKDENVNSQILLDQHIVKVFKNGLAFKRRQLVVRVLNEEGVKQWQSVWQVFQAARQDIKLKSARILRPGYGEISPLNYKTMPWNGDGKMVYDVWLFVVYLDRLQPGDVFEIQLEIDDTAEDNLFHDYFGDLVMVRREAPVEYFRYVLITDAGKKIYYNKPTFCPKPTVVHKKDADTYVWLGTNIPYIRTEPLMPGAGEIADPLHISTFSSWNDFVKWYLNMVKDQFTAGPRLKKKVQEITNGAKDARERLLRLFGFVSRDIRYIALELGVHSYKPYQANEILERGYGDCKDKATLLISMLKEVGIDANMVILRTRNNGSIGNFPPSLAMFNHAIVYVPSFDLFVDPTVTNSAMEALPWQDQGAQALILDPSTSGPITIPYTSAKGNISVENRTITLSPNLQVTYESDGWYKGVFAYSARNQFEDRSHQESTLEKLLNMQSPGAELIDYSIEGIDDPQSAVHIYVKARLSSYLKHQQERLLLPLELSPTNYVGNYAPLSQRSSPEVIPYPFCYELNAKYVLPAGFSVVSYPKQVSLESPFGSFSLSCSKDANGTIQCKRSFCLSTLRIEPNQYQSFREFLEKVDFAGTQNVEVKQDAQH